jgi:hypothetical protein
MNTYNFRKEKSIKVFVWEQEIVRKCTHGSDRDRGNIHGFLHGIFTISK